MDSFQRYLEEALRDIKIDNQTQEILVPQYSIKEDISVLLVKARESAKLTQKQLAQMTGLSQANISRTETEQTIPNLITLKKIADALGKRLVVTFSDFEGDETDGSDY